ncbi:hypothetical protein [Spirosoma pollinicola]|uniref:Uncharacterized protein n=1 Tax=Spirosoma pollinicola TaxID=2057025 RepID=A0A2K8Z5G1_9BACT|nr:hypothetical protein [Spirosoma pollinicola]AUD05059.1 hypothetical protein CWM47_26370 [Spirosoma pollinicola]
MTLLKKIKNIIQEIKRSKQDNFEVRFLMGSMLAKNSSQAKSIKEAEFKVFSQFGDDGIIQFLLNRIPIKVDKFVEFGVESYEESNTRFLLMHDNWQGLVIDGSPDNIAYIKNDPIYWRYNLTAISSFITAENINQLLQENGFSGKIGILSIDIDGNDYWVWQAINVCDPDIVVIEYNSLFGSERSITIPYKPDYYRMDAHYSGLYFGASLQALCDLGKLKGYALVGCNKAGNNAYFVKNNLVSELQVLSPEEGFVHARFREGRDKEGNLTFANEPERRKEILGQPVVNVKTGLTETF